MKILIALDDSPHSTRALHFVTRMRWPAGSRFIVISSVPNTAGLLAAAELPNTALPDLSGEQRQRIRELVERAESTLRESGFSAEARILDGDPREALLELAHSERADLLVVGSHGRAGLAKLMLGSVSSHVVTHARCSVLVVKGPETMAGIRKHGGQS